MLTTELARHKQDAKKTSCPINDDQITSERPYVSITCTKGSETLTVDNKVDLYNFISGGEPSTCIWDCSQVDSITNLNFNNDEAECDETDADCEWCEGSTCTVKYQR